MRRAHLDTAPRGVGRLAARIFLEHFRSGWRFSRRGGTPNATIRGQCQDAPECDTHAKQPLRPDARR